MEPRIFGKDLGEPPFSDVKLAIAYILKLIIDEEDAESYPQDVGDFFTTLARALGVTTATLGDRLTEVNHTGPLPRNKKDLVEIVVKTICPG